MSENIIEKLKCEKKILNYKNDSFIFFFSLDKLLILKHLAHSLLNIYLNGNEGNNKVINALIIFTKILKILQFTIE